ncbi:cell division protein ZipA C-terminal FtsZ-binding domain-containing protein [Silvimonas iriomotensis]|uniref:Cell division protein ZipA n=1 Tax=Silvimonas iriomotensis TaxID=449662 RepID=A0ABQ2P5K7_9NEIS|nr:cell division protein ZipA C-terminal FtsZ-binding domain-containing protein [Silvimonas iriomotensis]GGP18576.1 cell division protein ZipA [Silvimonas iriomotensis]
MTDLQLGSLIAGGAIVAAVYAFNWWQEHRYRKQAAKAFARNQPDVLLDTPQNVVRKGDNQRLEPALNTAVAKTGELREEPVLAGHTVGEVLQEEAPVAEEPAWTAPAPVAPRPAAQPAAQSATADEDAETSLLDPAFDFIAEVHAGVDIPAGEVPPFPAAKRVRVIGLNEAGQWQTVYGSTGNAFSELRIGLQLVDRQGALTQEQLNGFCMAVQQFADEHEASVTFPQRSAKLSAAAQLDEFCASVDVMIGLNVMATGNPLPMEKVRVLAEHAGLVKAPDGTFQYRSDSGKTLFSLTNHDQTPFGTTSEGVTLLFDVPRAAGGLSVFEYVCQFAIQLCTQLGATLVDDNGKPLTNASLTNIHDQLGQIYAQMDEQGIEPGSPAALRLFA